MSNTGVRKLTKEARGLKYVSRCKYWGGSMGAGGGGVGRIPLKILVKSTKSVKQEDRATAIPENS